MEKVVLGINLIMLGLAIFCTVAAMVIASGFIAHEYVQNEFTHWAYNMKFFAYVFALMAFFFDSGRSSRKENGQ